MVESACMQFNLADCLGELVGYVWGMPLVILLVGTGLYFTIALRGIQFRTIFHAIQVVRGKYDDPNDPGEISHFQALCTALSATVGLGNIAGVAVAINLGGPGAVFWMVLVGLLGMVTKFAESSLGVMYRKVNDDGSVEGGPMHYILLGLGSKWKPMAVFYAVALLASTFGGGNMFQANQVASVMNQTFSIPPIVSGIILAILTMLVIIKGIKRIGKVASFLLPFMAVLYFLGAAVIMFLNIDNLIPTFTRIIHDAFNGTAATGGFIGVVLSTVITQGVRRALFSNEAGIGTAAVAHSAAHTKEPIREGLVAMLGPFIDTVFICTLTAFVILTSGVPYWESTGVELTVKAFNAGIPGLGTYFIPVAVFLFAYSTLLSFSYYGEKAYRFLFGKANIMGYRLVYCAFVILGARVALEPVLNFSDIMMGLMIFPNVLALFLLRKKLFAATKDYFERMKLN